jgi:hypothetical protein
VDETLSSQTPSRGLLRRHARLRRPSGEAPPLPREGDWTRWIWVGAGVVLVGVALAGVMYGEPLGTPLAIDVSILRWAEGLRTTLTVDVARVFNSFSAFPAILALRLFAIVVLAFFKRWRHLAVALLTWAAMDAIATSLRVQLPSPSALTPPIPVIDGPSTYYWPGAAFVALSITLFSMVFAMVPAGPRSKVRGGVVASLVLVGCARILLAGVYPSAALYAVILGACVSYLVFEWLCPDEAFPVSYARGGNAAHLDLAGSRGSAVQRAMRDQLGIEVAEVNAFGDEGSGGSTPLLMTTDDGSRLFGKILATSHVRADRWYRMGRTILYGQLEDETPFTSVRRLIEYEDYALRVLDDDGFRVAKTYGIVELTPNREYLLPTEFFEGSETLGHAEVNDEIIDQGMALVRKLWDEGLAHRDIKPANLLVVDGHLQLIDVSGLENRPSPWRQAVDLANMMLVMALRSDAEKVYGIAQRYFTTEEVSEAFACAVGLAIPTELQRHLKEDGRGLVEEFKRLAPPHPPVSIQRWSARRIALTVGGVVCVVFVAEIAYAMIRSGIP